jgi:hypothetical protein
MKKRRKTKTKIKAKTPPGCVRSGRRFMIDSKTLQNSKSAATEKGTVDIGTEARPLGSSRNRVGDLMANYLRWTVPPFRKGRLSMKLVKAFLRNIHAA